MMKQNHEPSHIWFKLVVATRRLGFLRTSVNAGDNYPAGISTCPHKSLMQIPVWSESTTCKNILVIICYCCHDSKIKENLLLSYVLSKTIAKPAQQNKPLLSTSFRLKTSFKKKKSRANVVVVDDTGLKIPGMQKESDIHQSKEYFCFLFWWIPTNE